MIDDLRKTLALIARMKAALPIAVALTPDLQRLLAAQSTSVAIPERCTVVDVLNAGDEGGICCVLDLGGADAGTAHVVSLTHLRLDRRSPLFRDVDVYQRHRVKKLKRQGGRAS